VKNARLFFESSLLWGEDLGEGVSFSKAEGVKALTPALSLKGEGKEGRENLRDFGGPTP
jgi:hypothetical protein